MHWQIQTRHSPCVVKRTTLEAASEDEALRKFVQLNVETAQKKHTKNWKIVVRSIEEWMRQGGLDEVDIVEVAAPVLPDGVSTSEAVQEDASRPAPDDADGTVTQPAPAKKQRKRKVPVIAHPEPVTVSSGSDETEELKFVV